MVVEKLHNNTNEFFYSNETTDEFDKKGNVDFFYNSDVGLGVAIHDRKKDNNMFQPI